MEEDRTQKRRNHTSNKKNFEKNEFCSIRSYSPLLGSGYGFNMLDFFSLSELKSVVSNPIGENEILRKISLILYNTNGTYTNTVDYMTSLHTLDRVIVPHGNSKKKKKINQELMESTLRTIKDREIVRDALFKGMIEGIAFYYFETTERPISRKKFMTDYDVNCIAEINELGVNASIISLPTDYTKIVGIKNNSYVIAFNLDYFTTDPSESTEKKLRKYPAEIRQAYEKKKNGQAEGNWIILDNSKTIVHKIRSKRDEKWGRPLVLAAINDILYSDYFTDTKRNVLDEINNKIIYQVFPEGKEKGTCALTKQQQQQQHNTVKGAVLGKNNRGGTSFFSVAGGTKIDSVDASNTDIFDDKYESTLGDKIALDLGIAGSLLNGSNSGSFSAQENNLRLLTSQLFEWVSQIEAELNKCISKNIIKDERNWCEVKYLPMTYVNKKEMISSAKELYLSAGGSISLWSTACGIPSDVFLALCEKERESGVYDMLTPHQTSFTLSKGDVAAGRPETNTPSDNTVRSNNNGGNNSPRPSTT